jgi:A/G-specific adenine glycosylase
VSAPRELVSSLAADLLAWFGAAKRALPWRVVRTPYRVLVSEVMLQQTQVGTVVPFFERWMARFPSLEALAAAPLEDVLKAWEGLGYYSRARRLQEAARAALNQHGGLPRTSAALLQLPGVGPYTAAAVASLAFGERALAVDGNVKRVAARLFCLPGEVTPEVVRTRLEPHHPSDAPGDFNEALMELGALVCTARAPRCPSCPLRAHCGAYQTDQVARFPYPRARKSVPHVRRYALVCARGGALWLRRRPTSEMLGGLWGFPLAEKAPPGEQLESVGHAYTHFRITATPVLVENPPPGEGRFVTSAELAALPLAKLDHKVLEKLAARARSEGSDR